MYRALISLATILPWLLSGGILVAAGDPEPEHRSANPPRGFVRLVEIQDLEGNTAARVLTAVDWYEDRRVERQLVATPSGEHVVLAETELPLAGLTRLDVLVEETGWSAQLEVRGLRFDSIEEIANPAAVARRFVESEQPRSAVLTAPGLNAPFRHDSTTWDDRFFDDFFLILAAQGETRSLFSDMAPPTVRSLSFLASLAACGGCSVSPGEMSPFLTILGRLVGEEAVVPEPGVPAPVGWRTVVLETVPEGEALVPRLQRFIGEFRSVEPDDVLSDLRPRQGQEPEP